MVQYIGVDLLILTYPHLPELHAIQTLSTIRFLIGMKVHGVNNLPKPEPEPEPESVDLPNLDQGCRTPSIYKISNTSQPSLSFYCISIVMYP